MTGLQTLTAIIVGLTLIGVAVGRWPWLRMNRATIALVGATLPSAIVTLAFGVFWLGW